MGATRAIDVLERTGTSFKLHEYRTDSGATSYGSAAAEALGLDPREVLKTLVVAADAALAIAVIAVDSELDLKATARALGARKVALAHRARAERVTGYVIGGISPLGQKRSLTTVIDVRSAGGDVAFVSGGRRGLEIELAMEDLVALTNALLAPVARVLPR